MPQFSNVPLAGRKHRYEDDIEALAILPAMAVAANSGGFEDHDGGEDDSHGNSTKKRRKIGWTNTEDLTILAAVRRIGTQWQRIADNLPGRTQDAVRNRWHRLQKTHALNDTEEGRCALDGLLIASGVDPNWCPPELAHPAPMMDGRDQCIRGSDHGRHMWTAEEDRIIEEGVRQLGCKWRQVRGMPNDGLPASLSHTLRFPLPCCPSAPSAGSEGSHHARTRH